MTDRRICWRCGDRWCECDADQAGPVGAWLRAAMVEGMAPLIEPVPVEVEVSVGSTWGG
jgi:hypothetical protein